MPEARFATLALRVAVCLCLLSLHNLWAPWEASAAIFLDRVERSAQNKQTPEVQHTSYQGVGKATANTEPYSAERLTHTADFFRYEIVRLSRKRPNVCLAELVPRKKHPQSPILHDSSTSVNQKGTATKSVDAEADLEKSKTSTQQPAGAVIIGQEDPLLPPVLESGTRSDSDAGGDAKVHIEQGDKNDEATGQLLKDEPVADLKELHDALPSSSMIERKEKEEHRPHIHEPSIQLPLAQDKIPTLEEFKESLLKQQREKHNEELQHQQHQQQSQANGKLSKSKHQASSGRTVHGPKEANNGGGRGFSWDEDEARNSPRQGQAATSHGGYIPQDDDDDDDGEGGAAASRYNYASMDAGAIVVAAPKYMKGASNLLKNDPDQYMLSPCAEKKWLVVSLSEDIEAESVVIANFEKYSSSVKDFQVLGSRKHPTDSWILLGLFSAKRMNGEQEFRLKERQQIRFIKFRFITHHGSEFYCTLSHIRVYGYTIAQVLEQELGGGSSSEHYVRDDDEVIYAESQRNSLRPRKPQEIEPALQGAQSELSDSTQSATTSPSTGGQTLTATPGTNGKEAVPPSSPDAEGRSTSESDTKGNDGQSGKTHNSSSAVGEGGPQVPANATEGQKQPQSESETEVKASNKEENEAVKEDASALHKRHTIAQNCSVVPEWGPKKILNPQTVWDFTSIHQLDEREGLLDPLSSSTSESTTGGQQHQTESERDAEEDKSAKQTGDGAAAILTITKNGTQPAAVEGDETAQNNSVQAVNTGSKEIEKSTEPTDLKSLISKLASDMVEKLARAKSDAAAHEANSQPDDLLQHVGEVQEGAHQHLAGNETSHSSTDTHASTSSVDSGDPKKKPAPGASVTAAGKTPPSSPHTSPSGSTPNPIVTPAKHQSQPIQSQKSSGGGYDSIFRTLTKKIKGLEYNQSVFDRYLEDVNLRYASILLKMQDQQADMMDKLQMIQEQFGSQSDAWDRHEAYYRSALDLALLEIERVKEELSLVHQVIVTVKAGVALAIMFSLGLVIVLVTTAVFQKAREWYNTNRGGWIVSQTEDEREDRREAQALEPASPTSLRATIAGMDLLAKIDVSSTMQQMLSPSAGAISANFAPSLPLFSPLSNEEREEAFASSNEPALPSSTASTTTWQFVRDEETSLDGETAIGITTKVTTTALPVNGTTKTNGPAQRLFVTTPDSATDSPQRTAASPTPSQQQAGRRSLAALLSPSAFIRGHNLLASKAEGSSGALSPAPSSSAVSQSMSPSPSRKLFLALLQERQSPRTTVDGTKRHRAATVVSTASMTSDNHRVPLSTPPQNGVESHLASAPPAPIKLVRSRTLIEGSNSISPQEVTVSTAVFHQEKSSTLQRTTTSQKQRFQGNVFVGLSAQATEGGGVGSGGGRKRQKHRSSSRPASASSALTVVSQPRDRSRTVALNASLPSASSVVLSSSLPSSFGSLHHRSGGGEHHFKAHSGKRFASSNYFASLISSDTEAPSSD